MPPFQSSTARRLDAEPFADVRPPRVTGGIPQRRPLRVGLINNPLSGQNVRRGLLPQVADLLRAHPQVARYDAHQPDGLAVAVRELMERETEILIINGGDGTVQAVLTAVMSTPADALPLLAVLPGGTSNTTARNVGYGRQALPALQRILDESARGAVAGTVEKRATLRVERNDGPHACAPEWAMMFGAGGIYHGIRLYRSTIESRGMRGQLGAGIAIATFMAKVLSGNGGSLFPPLHADVLIDGEPVPREPYLGILASTMDRQILGLHTYWGTGPGPVRMTSMRTAPRRLIGALLAIIRGRSPSYLRPELGYRSVNAQVVRLTFDSGYTLDGELFHPGSPRTDVTLTARQCAYFLRGFQ